MNGIGEMAVRLRDHRRGLNRTAADFRARVWSSFIRRPQTGCFRLAPSSSRLAPRVAKNHERARIRFYGLQSALDGANRPPSASAGDERVFAARIEAEPGANRLAPATAGLDPSSVDRLIVPVRSLAIRAATLMSYSLRRFHAVPE